MAKKKTESKKGEKKASRRKREKQIKKDEMPQPELPEVAIITITVHRETGRLNHAFSGWQSALELEQALDVFMAQVARPAVRQEAAQQGHQAAIKQVSSQGVIPKPEESAQKKTKKRND